MVEASGGQIAKVARELKLHDSSLGNWVREAHELAAGAPTAAERAEIRELRAELGQRLPIRSAADGNRRATPLPGTSRQCRRGDLYHNPTPVVISRQARCRSRLLG